VEMFHLVNFLSFYFRVFLSLKDDICPFIFFDFRSFGCVFNELPNLFRIGLHGSTINLVEAIEPDQHGFRGVILLKAGHYSLDNILLIKKSGVVLRGEGQGLNGTVLHANPRVQHSVISILGTGGITRDVQSVQNITSDYVAVGSHSFEIEDVSVLSRTLESNLFIIITQMNHTHGLL